MSGEEVPFRSMKITLSEVAVETLDKIVKKASFRSSSSGIEECIRATYDVIEEIESVAGKRGDLQVTMTKENEAEAFIRILARFSRFTGRRVGVKTNK